MYNLLYICAIKDIHRQALDEKVMQSKTPEKL